MLISTKKAIFLQIFKKFVVSYKKMQIFIRIKIVLTALLILFYNINYNSQRNDFLFLIAFFKLFFKNNLKTKIPNRFVSKYNTKKLLNFPSGLLFSKKLFCFFNYIFRIYLVFFYVLRLLFALKRKFSLILAPIERKTSFSLYKKLYAPFLLYTTFSILLKKFFAILKLRVISYQKRLLNVLNCYIKFTRHNIFITITSSLNVPLLIYSSGKSGYGGKTKFKVSPQAASRSASLLVKMLIKKKLVKNLVVFIVSNRLFDKRIKSILSVFKQNRLQILYLVPQLLRYVGGVRQKKTRRV